MTRHNELIQYLIDKINLKSYLEIGVFNRAHNLDLIDAEFKLGVDPDLNTGADFIGTSDAFFSISDKKWDIIFLDGLHHSDQLKKDFENALDRLNDNGFIVMHDCNPHSEHITHVPRDSGEWTGDCYKFACTLGKYKGISFRTVDFDYGCAVIWKNNESVYTIKAQPEITWDYFQIHKDWLLNLISVEDFLKLEF